MKKFPILIGIISLVIIVGGIFLFTKKQNTSSVSTPPPLPASYEYFWGDGCPHCVNVEEFLTTWEGKDKVSIDKKEVFIRTEMNLEAPVLWSNNPCIVEMIQKYFETLWKTLI